jgi:iron complex transport system substrate-binding protein
MSLRTTIAAAAAPLLLVVACATALAGDFMDAAGRRVVLPDNIRRVMPAGPSADALIAIVAPEKLVSWSVPHPKGFLPARLARLPVTGQLVVDGPGPVMRLRPDLVIDAGGVSPQRIAFAEQMQQQTGVPYILIDNSIARTPATLRALGAVLGDADRGQDLSRYARHAIEALHGRLLIRPANERPHVYLARGPDGLETSLPGSPDGELIDEGGAINVATPLGRGGSRVRITREQLLGWNPEIVICTNSRCYDAMHRDPVLRRLSAVRQKKVYLMPSDPFGWIDEPAGPNRVVGLYWISDLFYPGMGDVELHSAVRDLYEKLYGVKLSDAQMTRLVRNAGVPPSQTFGMPAGGLGAAPGLGAPSAPGLGAAPGGLSTGPTPGVGAPPPGGLSTGPAPGLGSPAIVPGVPPPGRRGTPQLELPNSPNR